MTFITGRARFRLVVNSVDRKSLWAICLLLATSACGNSLYKVKPIVDLPPMSATAPATNLGGLTLRAAPLLLDEESQELFEANLPLSGLLPVRVEMVHNSGETIELKKVRFRLHDGEGNEWKMISARQAIGRILKANEVYAYNPQSRKTFEKEFRAYELDSKSPLTHSERRRSGFIIFQAPKKAALATPRGLVLSIEGLAQPATLTLN
ncbi:MAG TPA: hypothetical protein VGJ55_07935 [Pyrinomonadaceae bacterium]